MTSLRCNGGRENYIHVTPTAVRFVPEMKGIYFEIKEEGK